MSQRKIGKSWWVDFRYNYTRYRKKSPLNTAEGAKQYEQTLRGRLCRGEPLLPPRPTVGTTFESFASEWFDTYVVANNKPSEQASKAKLLRSRLLPFFGRHQLGDVTVDQVERFKGSLLASGLAPKSVNNVLAVLRKCLACAVEWGRVPAAPPVRPVKAPPRATDYLSEAEANQLRDHCLRHAEEYAMVVAALDTGMRLGELRALRWTDLDFEVGVISVARAVAGTVESSTKSNQLRTVPLTSELRDLLASRPRSSERVFTAQKGGVMPEKGSERLLERACAAAGVRRVGWHRLRHTFATRLVRRGTSLRAVQSLLGHSTVGMTERYSHVAPGHMREAIESLGVDFVSTARATGGQRAATMNATGSPVAVEKSANLNEKTPVNGVSTDR